jgi:hypothetical protein
MRSRHYDVAAARFLSRDPVNDVDPSVVAPYNYARGNPVMYADPLGDWSFSDIGNAIGGAINGAVNVVKKAGQAVVNGAAGVVKAIKDKISPPEVVHVTPVVPAPPASTHAAVAPAHPIDHSADQAPVIREQHVAATLPSHLTLVSPPSVLPSVDSTKTCNKGVARKPNIVLSRDGATVISNDGGSVISNDGGSLITNDGASLITNDGASLITNDGASLITNDGASLITNDGATIVSHDSGGIVSHDSGG